MASKSGFFKKILTTALLAAGGAGLFTYFAMTPRGQTFRSGVDERIADVPPLLTPEDLIRMNSGPQTISMNDGSRDFPDQPHLRTVLAGRGQQLTQPNIQNEPSAAFGAQQIGS